MHFNLSAICQCPISIDDSIEPVCRVCVCVCSVHEYRVVECWFYDELIGKLSISNLKYHVVICIYIGYNNNNKTYNIEHYPCSFHVQCFGFNAEYAAFVPPYAMKWLRGFCFDLALVLIPSFSRLAVLLLHSLFPRYLFRNKK